MKITNRLGLPAAFVRAVENRPYDKGEADFSATQLLRPAQIIQLSEQHQGEMTEDAADRLWALYGSAVHAMLEWAAGRQGDRFQRAEDRLFASIDIGIDRYVISGQMDNIDTVTGTQSDYKFVSVNIAFYGTRIEWEQQANIYRWLNHKNGHEIKRLEVIAMFRDWSKYKAMYDSNYPQEPVRVYEMPLWTLVATEDFIRQRIEHITQRPAPDCNDEERWFRPGKWALRKGGNLKAIKLEDTLSGVQDYAEHKKKIDPDELRIYPPIRGDDPPPTKDYWIERRPGTHTRCAGYCPVADFCPQWAKIKMEELNE